MKSIAAAAGLMAAALSAPAYAHPGHVGAHSHDIIAVLVALTVIAGAAFLLGQRRKAAAAKKR